MPEAAPDAAAGFDTRTTAPRRRPWGLVAAVLTSAVVLVLAGSRLAALVPPFAAWVQSLGAWGAAAFVLGYIMACVAFVPASLLTLAAGAVFGLVKGVALVAVGALLGAAASFLVARYALRAAVERRLARNPRLAVVDRALATDARRIVFLLRLSPVVPFSALNYALGTTRVRFADFLLGSIGILPGTVLYVYYGKVAGTLAAAAGGAPARGPTDYLALGAGLLATLGATFLITRAARRALDAATPAAVAQPDAPAAGGGEPSTRPVAAATHG